jgi:hypothetical protein
MLSKTAITMLVKHQLNELINGVLKVWYFFRFPSPELCFYADVLLGMFLVFVVFAFFYVILRLASNKKEWVQ